MTQRDTEPYPNDRRMNMRYPIQAPAVVTIGRREIWAFTRDVSTSSVYLRISADEATPAIGEPIDFVIKIPPTMTFATTCFILGSGRILRTESTTWDETGLVVEVLEFQIQTRLMDRVVNHGLDSGLTVPQA